MIKNVFLKNLLINTVFGGISLLNSVTKKDDKQILLYSDLGFRDNIRYLYDHLIEEGYNKKYHIVVAVKGYEKFEKDRPLNVTFVSTAKGVFEYLRSGHIYYCFGKLPIRPAKGQTAVQMWHGTSFKGFAENQIKTTKQDAKHLFYTHVFASSDYFVPIVEKKFAVPRSVVCVAGHPRTDIMFRNRDTKCYSLTAPEEKMVLWLPTFRKSKAMGMADGDGDRLIPILDETDFKEIDRKLEEIHVKLIVKLHPMQDISGKQVDYSNFKLMSHAEFVEKGYDLYKLLSDADALITDYSSVFYDYLLLDRPIGFTEDDVEMYRDSRGFAVDPERFRPGRRIRTKQDFILFFAELVKGIDSYKAQRKEILTLSNAYCDDGNCNRALELCGIRKDG